jgi:hypothetical protein
MYWVDYKYQKQEACTFIPIIRRKTITALKKIFKN